MDRIVSRYYSHQLEEPIRIMRIIARLNIGGPAVHVCLLTAYMADSGFHTTLVAGNVGDEEGDMAYLAEKLTIQPVLLPTLQREISLWADIAALRALISLIMKERPHIVHTHTAKAGFVGRLAAALCGVPVIIHTFHGHVLSGYFSRAKSALFILLEKGAALATDRVLTISERLRCDLLRYRIAPSERVEVVPLGLEIDAYRDLGPFRGQFRSQIGASIDEKIIGIVGRLVPIKNHRMFLEAAHLVLKDMPGTYFVIVGDGELRDDLEACSKEMGLAGKVNFAGWQTDLRPVYADLSCVVICSDNEGTPVSLIEAMAAGIPVAGTRVGGIPDLLCDGEFGELVEPRDPDGLALAIRRCLSAPDTDRLRRAQEYVRDKYGIGRLVHDLSDLYVSLLEEKGFQRASSSATQPPSTL